MVVADADGRITFWSIAAQRIFGYSEAAILGQPLAMLMPERVLNRPIELMARHRDGHSFPVEISLSSWSGAEGVFFCGIIRDITERRAAQEAAKLQAIGLLAGGIAHDFNNIVTAIYGCTDVLRADLPPDSALREQVEMIQDGARRAAGITRHLLAFSRRQIMTVAPVDVNQLIERAHTTLTHLLPPSIRVDLRLAPELPAIAADEAQLEQVILNLAVNAREAMPDGGRLLIETMVVELDEDFASRHPAADAGRHVLIAVSDTGVGMDAATQARVFEPFFTTKGYSGSGLGLSTVYGIVKQSGGNIWVYSEPNHGTTFKVYFPVAGEAPAGAPALEPHAPSGASSECIFLVEDDPAIRRVTTRTLRSKGFTVIEAGSAEDALTISAEQLQGVDVLVTDVVLPGLNGAELAAALAARKPGLQVLFVSGYTENAISQHGVLDPGVEFLQKPFTPRMLAQRLRQILDQPSA